MMEEGLGGEAKMADVRWIKVVVDLFEDEKMVLIETMEGADSLLVLWLKLLCLAGKQNNSGVFVMKNGQAYTETMLAVIFRRSEQEVARALEVFEEFGMIERCGGVVVVKNWGKHQNFDKIEKKTAYMRDYMRGYRAKQAAIAKGEEVRKANHKAKVSCAEKIREEKIREDNTCPAAEDCAVESACAPVSGAELFERFWQAYPRKEAKKTAKAAFEAAAIGEEELEGVLAMVAQCKRSAQWTENKRYIPMAARFLTERRWEGEAPPSGVARRSKHKLKNLEREAKTLARLEDKWLGRGVAGGGGEEGEERAGAEDFQAQLAKARGQGGGGR